MTQNSKNSDKSTNTTRAYNKNPVETASLPEVVVKDDEGVYVEEVSGKPLSDDPSYVPEPVEEGVSVFETVADTKVEEGKGALNKKIRARLEEIEGQGKSVVYPTNEGAWDQALLDRLNKA